MDSKQDQKELVCAIQESQASQQEQQQTASGQEMNNTQVGPTDQACCKENQNSRHNYERFCFACDRSLAKSRHLINIAGQLHRWHPECFKCQVCNHPLDKETSCHIYKEKIVCKHDYVKLQRDNTAECARCRWPIGALDWVRKAGEFVYHLACFTCDICLRQLSTGEQFTLSIQEKNVVRLLCRLHFAIENNSDSNAKTALHSSSTSIVKQGSNNKSTSSTISGSSSFHPFNHYTSERDNTKQYSAHHFATSAHHDQASASYLQMLAASTSHLSAHKSDQQDNAHLTGTRDFDELPSGSGNLSGSVHSKENLQQQQQLVAMQQHHHHHHVQQRAGTSTSTSSSNGSTASNMIGLPSKSKRVRTTFTEDQLSILQTHFQIDSNPDGQDLERIATITGLSKRVTQVWFQNSRARQKKYLIKRKPSSASSSVASAVATTTIGLSGNSSAPMQNSHFQQQLLSTNETVAKVDSFNQQQQQYQPRSSSVSQPNESGKWSNISDQSSSDLSLDATGPGLEDEAEDSGSRSSDGQQNISDVESINEQEI